MTARRVDTMPTTTTEETTMQSDATTTTRRLADDDAIEVLCIDEDPEIARTAQRVRNARNARDLVIALPLLEKKLGELVTARAAASIAIAVGGAT